jgi:prepilin-type N-terminal cleavage/methylation domain-containing protein
MSYKQGFTIVELLIVIVVIAILAAISIVAYNGIQNRANNSSVESDMSNLAKTMELWKVDNGSRYPSIGQLNSVGIRASKNSYYQNGRNNFYYCTNVNGSQYAFGVISKPNEGYMLSNGMVTKRPAADTWQANTCASIGEPSESGTSAYNGGNNQWSGWVNG